MVRFIPESVSLRRVLLTYLVVTLALSGVMAAWSFSADAHNRGADGYRIFHSDDKDPAGAGELKNISNVDKKGDTFKPAEYARATDLAYPSTRPGYQVEGTTVMDLRKQRLKAVSWSSSNSKVLPMTENTKSSGVIKDAHVTVLGVVGGAKPMLKKGNGNSYPYFMSNSGSVLNYVDYRIDQSELPDDYCENKQTHTHQEEHKVDDADYNETTGEKIDEADFEMHKMYDEQTRTCHDFRIEQKRVVRTLTIGSGAPVVESGTGGAKDGRVLGYGPGNAQADGVVTMKVEAVVTVGIVEVITDEARPDTGDAHDASWGSWSVDNTNRNYGYPDAQVTVSDKKEVLITTNQQMQIDQTVVNVGPNKKNIVLEFKAPGGGSEVKSNQLMNRALLSRVVVSENKSVQNTWSAYTVQQYDHAVKRTGDGSKQIHFNHVLQTRLYASSRLPSVVTSNVKSSEHLTKVIGWEGSNVTVQNKWNAPSLGSNVNLTSKVPLVYNKMVIVGAPDDVDKVLGVHGRPITNIDTQEIPYHQASVRFNKIDKRKVRITVTDNATGAPLQNRKVTLSGAERKTVRTDSNGEIVVKLSGSYLQAKVDGDNWKQPCAGDAGRCVFIGSVQASQTYMGASQLLSITMQLFKAMLAALPIVFAYFWWRAHKIGS